MSFEDTHFLGSTLIVVLGLLSGYLMLLRLRDYFREYPDPKLTYATLGDHEKLSAQVSDLYREHKKELSHLREAIKCDHETLRTLHGNTAAELFEITKRNSENIARLIAHNETTRQRISELTIKTDKIIERHYQS